MITQRVPSGCENPEESLTIKEPKLYSFLAQLLMLIFIFLIIPRTTFALGILATICLPFIVILHELLHSFAYKLFKIDSLIV